MFIATSCPTCFIMAYPGSLQGAVHETKLFTLGAVFQVKRKQILIFKEQHDMCTCTSRSHQQLTRHHGSCFNL